MRANFVASEVSSGIRRNRCCFTRSLWRQHAGASAGFNNEGFLVRQS